MIKVFFYDRVLLPEMVFLSPGENKSDSCASLIHFFMSFMIFFRDYFIIGSFF